jgi:hypothetical protein
MVAKMLIISFQWRLENGILPASNLITGTTLLSYTTLVAIYRL